MAQAYSDEQRRLASVLGIGTMGYLMALFLILIGTGGWFWVGVGWLACGAYCTLVLWILRSRILDRRVAIVEWLVFPGWGALIFISIVVFLSTEPHAQ